MSEENVELARRGYDAFSRGDMDAMLAVFAPEFEYTPTGAIPDTRGVYVGADGWRAFAGWMASEFENPRIDVRELTDVGNQVLASVTLRGRGKQSGVEVGWDVWHVWTVRKGKVVRGQAFTSRREALEAAGLSE